MDNIIEFNRKKTTCKPWEIDITKTHIAVVKNYLLNDGISQEGVNNIIINGIKILGYCADPKTQDESKKTGIVIGKVQSGKTSNFIALIGLAFDNGYDIVVLLGGTKKNLVEQNKERMEDYFEKDPDVIVLDAEKNMSQINTESLDNFIRIGKKIIIVTLKSAAKLDKLRTSIFENYRFKNRPTIILDDEGDEYSLNTLIAKGKKSKTYEAICNLLDKLRIRTFISVTATPQANLIINTLDILSPDFGILVYPGDGYCGLNKFHLSDNKYCVTIPDNEKSLLEDNGVPSSYYDALSMFFVAIAIYRLRENDDRKKISMMVHPSFRVNDITNVCEKTKIILSSWKSFSLDITDISFETVKNHLLKAYNEYKNGGVEVGSFEDVCLKAADAIQRTGIHKITGNNQLEGNDKYYDNNIYIGGQMVGRGLTIKGLVVTYIIRDTKGVSNVDTVQQRARWFGYKEDILDLCRIFATRNILDCFSEIRIHEDEMWETIENSNSNGTNFKEMKRLFVLSDKLRMTRTSVGKTEKYTFTSWKPENKFLQNENGRKHNTELLNNLKTQYIECGLAKKDYTGENSLHLIVENLNFYDVLKNDLRDYISPNDPYCNLEIFKKMCSLFIKYEQTTLLCNLVWMRNYEKSYHNIREDYKIPNYFVGRRPENVSEELCTYKGDRKYCSDNNITVQIHRIVNKLNNREENPVLAIHIPDCLLEKLKNIIIPDWEVI